MNATEFRAVLDWWIASDPMPEGITESHSETIAAWLDNESVQRGYLEIIDAYHRHKP